MGKLTAPSQLTTAGLSETAPVVTYAKEFQAYFSNASNLLGEVAQNVKIEHDDNWEVYPEVAAAIKVSGAEEDCYAVAMSVEHGVWGVGLAAGWKTRESSAKLALALAVAQATGQASELTSRYPDFASLCAAAGLSEPANKRR